MSSLINYRQMHVQTITCGPLYSNDIIVSDRHRVPILDEHTFITPSLYDKMPSHEAPVAPQSKVISHRESGGAVLMGAIVLNVPREELPNNGATLLTSWNSAANISMGQEVNILSYKTAAQDYSCSAFIHLNVNNDDDHTNLVFIYNVKNGTQSIDHVLQHTYMPGANGKLYDIEVKTTVKDGRPTLSFVAHGSITDAKPLYSFATVKSTCRANGNISLVIHN